MPRLLICATTAVIVVLAGCSTPPRQEAPPPEPLLRTEESLSDQAVEKKQAEMEQQRVASTTRATDATAGSASAGQTAERKALSGLSPSRPVAPLQSQPAFFAQPLIQSKPPVDTENYAHYASNPLQIAAEHPVSTFSIDVDTGSYANVRRLLREGRLPPSDAVRVEELVNYFDYAYAVPEDTSVPFSVSTEMAPTPWNAKTHLLRVGIQGWKPKGARPRSNLVFLVDVSGSMQNQDKLPLVKSSLKMLARDLTSKDRLTLVVYAGASGVVLQPTPGDHFEEIAAALDRLQAGGSTNGASGIQLAYAMARKNLVKDGNNRVLLATDGDFNVGITSFEALLDLVKQERKSGIALTTLGFGTGNYNDHLMEQLADAGQGNYAYIDSIDEARKVLVEQRDATLRTIAADVKIQIEFNPAVVSEYRLIGYENRVLKREDFNNDQVDAGEIGAGHRVTALYEIALAGSGGERVEPLRYQSEPTSRPAGPELAFLRLRYKRPGDGAQAASRLIERPLKRDDIKTGVAATSDSFRLAAAVAAFGQLLRGGAYTGTFGYAQASALAANAGRSERVEELRQLIAQAARLSGEHFGSSEQRGGPRLRGS